MSSSETSSRGLSNQKKWPAVPHFRRRAPGIFEASDSPFSGGITASAPPWMTSVGARIFAKYLVELNRARAPNCRSRPHRVLGVAANWATCLELGPGRPRRPGGAQSWTKLWATRACAAASPKSLSIQRPQSSRKSGGGGRASRPPCVVAPKVSDATRPGDSRARCCETMPPMEIPRRWTLFPRAAASRTSWESRAKSWMLQGPGVQRDPPTPRWSKHSTCRLPRLASI
mmetsp:Transcript_5516/g.12806  ORF Transcript_5516/g.12806 Transcript_5516/m.12806 type:complete len:229 (-) Transcript_5516:201-887(-)